jgi:hypothetical protein
MRRSVARMKDPVLEVLLFQVGTARFAVGFGQVKGLVRDLPDPSEMDLTEDPHCVLFEGREVPVFPACDFMQGAAPPAQRPTEAIIFDDGAGLYGMAVDRTERVLSVTPGENLYTLPPRAATDANPCRAWAVLTVAEKPVILLDMSRVAVH